MSSWAILGMDFGGWLVEKSVGRLVCCGRFAEAALRMNEYSFMLSRA